MYIGWKKELWVCDNMWLYACGMYPLIACDVSCNIMQYGVGEAQSTARVAFSASVIACAARVEVAPR